FVVFFSVFTHLTEKESYCYLREAKRVLKKTGTIIISYLDFDIDAQAQMAGRGFGNRYFRMLGKGVLNQLLSSKHHCLRIVRKPALSQLLTKRVLDGWSEKLGLPIEYVDAGEQIGQSICAYRFGTIASVT